MQNNADWAINGVLASEGGYVNNPNDKGGPTNKGITLTTMRRYLKPKATVTDLKALTTAQAFDIYRQQYWNAVRADELPSGVDYAVFDFAVNSGPARAIKYMQQVLKDATYYTGGIDGKIGPLTLDAIRAMPSPLFINKYCNVRLEYLELLSTWAVFGTGWTNRVTRVRRDALAVADKEPAPVAEKQSLWSWIVWLLHKLFKRTV